MFRPMPTVPADIQMPAADPQEVAKWLAAHPRKLMLISTSDGLEYEFQNDGGKVTGVFNEVAGGMVYSCQPNGRAQNAIKAATSKRQDKGFTDRPAFVSTKAVEPAFAGDILHTGIGGCIKIADEADAQTVEDSKSVAARRRVRIRAEAQAAAREFAKIADPSAPTSGPDIASLIADAEQRAADRASEREAALLKQIEELKAAGAPAAKATTKRSKKAAGDEVDTSEAEG